MASEATARASYIGPMRFDVQSGSGHTITLDVSAVDGGQNSGPTPMELLVMGLAGCTGMDVISILRKRRQDVTGYEIRVHGTRAPEHPRVFVEIEIEHIIHGRDVRAADVARAIELSDTKYCGVGATLSKSAKITSTFRIIEAA
jgi:putative redox protein